MVNDQLQSRHGLVLKVLVAIIALIVLGGAAVVIRSRYVAPGNGAESRGGVVSDRYKVRRTSFDMIVPASGELEALKQDEIRNLVEGRDSIIKWLVDEGTRVEAGDIVIELADDDIRNRIEEEMLRVEAARSDLVAAEEAVEIRKSENDSSERKAILTVTQAQLELSRWLEGEVVTKRKDIDVRLTTAERNFEQREKDFKNSVKLFQEGFISESERTDDENRLTEAKAELEKAELASRIYEEFEYPKDYQIKTSAVEEAEAELARVRQSNARTLAQREAELVNSKRQLAIREDRLKNLEQQLEACTMRAPNDGLVVYGTSVGNNPWRRPAPLDIGQEVDNNQLLIILPNTSEMVASVRVHETQSSQIKPGMAATVRVDAVPKESFKATVRTVGVIAEQAGFGSQVREYSVKLLLDEENEFGLKPSMRCKSEIILGHVDDVIAVPIQAVFTQRRESYVWVADGNLWKKQPVKTGRYSETMIEIQEGLSENQYVLLREPEPNEVRS